MVIHSQFEFSQFGAGPRLGNETANRQAVVIEQRHQDEDPPLAKDTDQSQLGGPTLAVGQEPSAGQRQQGLGGDRRVGCSADTEKPSTPPAWHSRESARG